MRPSRDIVSVHPGSGGKDKCWPLPKFIELISRLSHKGEYDFRFLLGPAEDEETFQRLFSFIRQKGIRGEILRNEPVKRVAATLIISSLYIGNDSGITHLAGALGVPTVAVFGPTDPEIWGPVGEKVKVVRSRLACSPCGQERYRGCNREMECLKKLGVSAVLKKIAELPDPLCSNTNFLKGIST